jgi:hypothetical protein
MSISLNRPRVAVYEVVMTPETASFFPFEDLGPAESQERRLLDDWLGNPLPLADLTTRRLNPEIFGASPLSEGFMPVYDKDQG